jgi:ABC-type transport system substrate-binding protein
MSLNRIKKGIRLFAIVLLTSAAAVANGAKDSGSASAGNTLRVGCQLEVLGNMDVMITSQNTVFQISDTITDTLMGKRDSDLALFPLLLAKTPDISPDGLLYTCTLRKGVKFHDGTELTADDVLFTFNRFFNPKTQANMVWLCDDVIKGARDVEQGKTVEVSGLKKTGDYTFTIELKYPFSAFTSILAASPLGIISKAACLKAGDKWGLETYIGCGAYKVASFTPKQEIVLEKFPEYWAGAKSVDKIIISNMDQNTQLMEFDAGNIDVCDLPTSLAPDYLKNPAMKSKIKYQEFMGIWGLHFNMAIPPFNNVKVRQALAYAVDLNSLCTGYYKGAHTPARSLIPKGIPGYVASNPVQEYNPEKAKQLLAEAGFPNGLKITAAVKNTPEIVECFQVLQDQFKKSGIDMAIELCDPGSWAQKRKQDGGTQLYMITWYADYVDPDMYLYLLYHSSVSDNFANGFSPKYNAKDSAWYDSQVELGRRMTDPAKKAAFYADLERWLTTKYYAEVPLYCASAYYLVSDRVSGVTYKPDFLYSYENAVIK